MKFGAAKTDDFDLHPNSANFQPLSPVSYLDRAAVAFAGQTAWVHGERRASYAEMRARCRRLGSALVGRGVQRGDVVAALALNTPALLEAHYGVPMIGAVLNPINTRLDAATVAFILRHGEAKAFLVDAELAPIARAALESLDDAALKDRLLIVDIADPEAPDAEPLGGVDYEALLAEGDPGFAPPPLDDEWRSLSLLYTSGTTGDPKGVVYSHRGAYLTAMSNALAFGLEPRSVYLWTLPMFHCNGWCYTWAATAAGATHVCLRRIEPARVFELIDAERVTHLCGAPIVLSMLINGPTARRVDRDQPVKLATGGAPPPSAVLAAMERLNFDVIHLYGLTETYGPSTGNFPTREWDSLSTEAVYERMARQGVSTASIEDYAVLDPATLERLPKDGESLGELALRGNSVMKGYLKNPTATEKALKGGWFLSGDLAVWRDSGEVEVRDRSKDIIISGGENISSIEVEDALYQHPSVAFAAVVARPDPTWGETPCAFVTLKDGASLSEAELIDFSRQKLAKFKIPKTVVFGELPMTATGKIQKFVLRQRAKNI